MKRYGGMISMPDKYMKTVNIEAGVFIIVLMPYQAWYFSVQI